MTFDTQEALALEEKVLKTKLPFAVTHTYTGYPMVKEAKEVVKSGRIGKLRKIAVEYPQGWLTEYLESNNHKQASWRTDPKRSGKAGSMGDIGTHAANMVEYVTGLKILKLSSISIYNCKKLMHNILIILFNIYAIIILILNFIG